MLCVLELVVRLMAGDTGQSRLTEYLGLLGTPSIGLLQNNSALSAKQRGAITRTFEYGSDTEVVLAGLWREVVVEKSHIAENHHHYARVPTESVSRCYRR